MNFSLPLDKLQAAAEGAEGAVEDYEDEESKGDDGQQEEAVEEEEDEEEEEEEEYMSKFDKFVKDSEKQLRVHMRRRSSLERVVDSSSLIVAVRVRPLSQQELAAGSESCVECVSPVALTVSDELSELSPVAMDAAPSTPRSSLLGPPVSPHSEGGRSPRSPRSPRPTPAQSPRTRLTPSMSEMIKPRSPGAAADSSPGSNSKKPMVRRAASSLAMASPRTPRGGSGSEKKMFTFDVVFPVHATQVAVYTGAVRIMLQRALQGYNTTVFAYGQTGAGKTFTMEGSDKDPGVIPQLCQEMFDTVKQSKDKVYEISVCYVEIYLDTLRDLLLAENERVGAPVIKQSQEKGVYVDNVVRTVVANGDDVMKVIRMGTERRTVAATRSNQVSSRSHAVLTMFIQSRDAKDKEGFSTVTSQLHLIDLAGSERADTAGTMGDRLQEGAKINKSLSALGNVITALSDQKGKRHVPYRDSKLTRLLQDSLGGNAVTLVICNVSPAELNRTETLSTLRFAQMCKKVENKPLVNKDPKVEAMMLLRQEVEFLKMENRELKEKVKELEEARLEAVLQATAGQPPSPGDAHAGRGAGKPAAPAALQQSNPPASGPPALSMGGAHPPAHPPAHPHPPPTPPPAGKGAGGQSPLQGCWGKIAEVAGRAKAWWLSKNGGGGGGGSGLAEPLVSPQRQGL